jgi:hypothetical protein
MIIAEGTPPQPENFCRPDGREHSNMEYGGIASIVLDGIEHPAKGIFLHYGSERNLRLGVRYLANRVLLNYVIIDSIFEHRLQHRPALAHNSFGVFPTEPVEK